MTRACAIALAVSIAATSTSGQQQQQPSVSTSTHHDVSRPLREVPAPAAAAPAIEIEKLSAPGLRYVLLQHTGDVWVCPPRLAYANEEQRRIDAFAKLKQDSDTLRAILAHLGFKPGASYSGRQKLAVYREYERLSQISLDPGDGGSYQFEVTVKTAGDKGEVVSGEIARDGVITQEARRPALLRCPL